MASPTSEAGNVPSSSFDALDERAAADKPEALWQEKFSYDLPGAVIIDPDTTSALAAARSEYNSKEMTSQGGRMVFWTDASTNGGFVGRSGMGVVYKRGPSRWISLSYHVRKEVNIWAAEMGAIAKALQIADEEVTKTKARPSVVVIYSDSHRALWNYQKGGMQSVWFSRPLAKPGLKAAYNLRRLGIEIELRWIPGHFNQDHKLPIKGHVLAHSAARNGARFKPLPHINDFVVDHKSNPKKKKRATVAIFKTGVTVE
ncbi:uncharacterized protein LY89DRAFT_785412 [Mollisia scopiformis]|uniref:RNase H type-1 domain-containing protein n=1 Tax=Mollisia scopiformis TaxID=149040 RepID=A0A194WXZ2_MOLSC|nr:uncharacterized protein LY89DRAFT_785412 [Mollisia scopiformis]KUJ12843.1 hypothetical protein LY89DRAFT_785412 [Mollisia scopiformis]